MGRSERKTINSKLRRKDKGAISNGERRGFMMAPKRSERKWWKADYTGDWYPNYYTNEALSRHVEKCRKGN